jgi:Prophage minor tail protein Z (GPZ)
MTVLLKVDASEIEALAKDIGVAAAVIERTLYRAINTVAGKAMTRTRREIVSQVNLTQTYVRERIALRKANKGDMTAVVAARKRATRLATYGARQRMKAVKAPKSLSSEARAKYMAKLTGDKLRGIPAGKKQAGVSVSVKRGGSRKLMAGGFMVPLRAGNVAGGNAMGVFIRTGGARNARDLISQEISTSKGSKRPRAVESGNARHLYGPSVDQVMKSVINDISPDVSAELEAAIRRQAQYEFEKALKK